MKIREAIAKFFGRVEATPCPSPSEEELVDGKAFTIRHYPQKQTIYVQPTDTLTATISENGEVIARVSEPISVAMTIDTISTLRFNDALGYKHAVGVLFGQRKS